MCIWLSTNDFLSSIHQIYVPYCLIFWRIQKNLRGMQMVVHDEMKTMHDVHDVVHVVHDEIKMYCCF